MTWRHLLVQNKAHLSIKNAQLTLHNEEGRFSFPLEDLACLILECHHITLTNAVLACCQEHGVTILTCDARHMPVGVMHTFHMHSRQSKVASIQIKISSPFKKRCWQAIVKEKVKGQAFVLKKYGHEKEAQTLLAMQNKVTSGDEKNIEARAARTYWKTLFGNNFKRHQQDSTNGALDYGYAIMRAMVARSLVAFGLLPTFGLHHNNDLNAFNLADDILEIFRPFVDDLVVSMTHSQELAESLSKENRQKLAGLPYIRCHVSKEVYTILNASNKVVEKLLIAIEHKNPQALTFPSFKEGTP